MLNVWLIEIPGIGVYGAAIGSIVNNIIACALSYIVLAKSIKLDIKFTKCVIKPLIATTIMGICSYYIYLLIKGIISVRIATIIAIIVAIIIYALSLIVLKILDKEEMKMIPYGTKLVKVLESIGIYGKGRHCK